MRVQVRSLVRHLLAWPPAVWFWGLGLVLLIRFPLHFVLQPPFLMDFEVYRFIANRLLSGDALHLYDPTTSARMVFKSSPFWAIVMVPLGGLSSHAGSVVWSMLNVAWLILTVWLCDRIARASGLKPPGWLAVPVVLLLVRSLTAEFLQGQINLLWGLLAVAFIFCHITHRRWQAALWLALAISLKLPALLFLASAILTRRWGLTLRTGVWLVVINGLAAWCLVPSHPWSLFGSWQQTLRANAMTYAFDISNQSLLALLGRLLRHDGYGLNLLTLPEPTIAALALILQLILFGLVVWAPRSLPRDAALRVALDSALLGILMVLCSPSAWPATFTAMFFAVYLAVALGVTHPDVLWRRAGFGLTAGLTLLFSALTHAKFWRAMGVFHIHGESYVFLVLMILPLFGLSLAAHLWSWRHLPVLAVAHPLIAPRHPRGEQS